MNNKTIKIGKYTLSTMVMMTLMLEPKKKSCAYYSENEIRQADIVIRAGEWGNKETAKPGKRYNWGKDINISKHGISIKEIPSDIPLRQENGEWFISEFDINLKLAKAIAKKLDTKYGVNTVLHYSTDKTTDLNSAGRRALKCDPKIYLSVHHNYYSDDSTGYFFMYNEGDTKSSEVANKLSNSISKNGKIPQRNNMVNNGYIGELNQFKGTGKISVLGEFGYFNKAEIVKICSDEYVDYVSDKISEELYNQLQKINSKETMMIDNKNKEYIKITIKDEDAVVNNTRKTNVQEVIKLNFK